MTKIHSPARSYTGTDTYGTTTLTFEDGVAEYDGDLPSGVRQYLTGAGYGIDTDPADPAPAPEPPDPRDLTNVQGGAPLRDAAVDPRPEDFLPPTNAGEANPHGPLVVSPGIHAVNGPGPIVPGPVGRFEEDEDGAQVVITDTEEQQRRETTAAEQVFLEQRNVGDVTEELGEEVGQPAPTTAVVTAATGDRPAGNASREVWHDYAVAQGRTTDELDGLGRDAIRDLFA